ncbi:uncharacterized protein LOC132749119 [Ruditapes philippinarum]|uniref:uncharacterized protein LOC132749119 n=1 Tax=Ruditapes philippinarum TaxID=129788 RepID=UPI00295B0443|nr:uncharacterized protein LOC132749119 [Ruditapes philippinarum]
MTMFKGILILLIIQLVHNSLAFPNKHRIAKKIRHVNKGKNHPCKSSKEGRNFSVAVMLRELQQDINELEHQLPSHDKIKDDKKLADKKRPFRGTLFKMSALCGEEILYDMSLVLEYFRDELLEIGEQSKSVLKEDQLPIKENLYKTINHLRNAVLALRPTAMDKNKVEVKIPSSKKFYKKWTKIVLDLKQFIKTCLTIIDLK